MSYKAGKSIEAKTAGLNASLYIGRKNDGPMRTGLDENRKGRTARSEGAGLPFV
jgi:hypothetical protein